MTSSDRKWWYKLKHVHVSLEVCVSVSGSRLMFSCWKIQITHISAVMQVYVSDRETESSGCVLTYM